MSPPWTCHYLARRTPSRWRIDIVEHIDRIAGQRRVAQVISVDGYDNRKDQFITNTL